MNSKIRRPDGVMALPAKKGAVETVSWLSPARVRAGRRGDLLVVLLSSAVFIMLGLAAMIVRFGPHDAPATIGATAPRSPAPATSSPAPAAASDKVTLRGSETSVGSNPARAEPVAPQRQTQTQVIVSPPPRLPANALVPAPGAREAATVAAAPISAQPTDVAFARNLPPAAAPVVAPVANEPASVPRQREARLLADADRSIARKPEAATPQAAKPEIVAASPEAGMGSGGAGATWAAYFDSFPDQKAAAGQINALQSKYGPHLGGRRLTYARSGDGWRLRASGLTQAEAAQMCESVRKSGSACAIGAR